MGFFRQEYWSGVPSPSRLNVRTCKSKTYFRTQKLLTFYEFRILTSVLWVSVCNSLYLKIFIFLLKPLVLNGSSDGICLQCRRPGFNPWVVKIPWRRKWKPTPVFLPGEFHGQRSLVGTVHEVTKSWTQLSDFHFQLSEEYLSLNRYCTWNMGFYN